MTRAAAGSQSWAAAVGGGHAGDQEADDGQGVWRQAELAGAEGDRGDGAADPGAGRGRDE